MPKRHLLLDACVAVNLAATDSVESIARALDTVFLMVAQAAAEVGFLRDQVDGRLVKTKIDLNRYVSVGVMRTLSLDAAELEQYIELAALVDDGEAATIAVAATRHIQMATDDRKARRVCERYGLPQPIRSLSILRSYADAAALSRESVREQLIRVRSRASFRPPHADPDHKWWSLHVAED